MITEEVASQQRLLIERPVTNAALKWRFAGVRAYVSNKVAFLGKRTWALGTFERFFASVHSDVGVQMALEFRSIGAQLA